MLDVKWPAVTEAAGRRSLGGSAVDKGLTEAGYRPPGAGVAVVETRRPGPRPFDVVLAQNAWNVLPRPEFERLCAPYPRTMVRRMRLRRAAAAVNLRRAGHVVCLTEAMARLVRHSVRREVEVAPVWVPMDLSRMSATGDRSLAGAVLVPGTVTWFKNPEAALSIARQLGLGRVVFAGRDDGSGCWPDVLAQAAALGVSATRTTLSRQEMYDAMVAAEVVVLPSRLESLGFALGEALALAPRVVAAPLPAHREVADRIARQPVWLPLRPGEVGAPPGSTPRLDAGTVLESWRAVGEALGLAMDPAKVA